MLKVGLTGGIGSGKSTVSNLFEKLGVSIIDTDLISRELVEPGRPALQQLADHFGQDVLNADGSLNRGHLRQHIFGHPEERHWLESLLHPLIRQEVQHRIQSDQGLYTIVVIPLLTENYRQDYPFLDRICVVDCEDSLQLARTTTRDGISPELAAQMLKSQLSREVRLTLANDIITNNHDLSALELQVMALHQKYLNLAAT
jgi:dephospho-CoA kinase